MKSKFFLLFNFLLYCVTMDLPKEKYDRKASHNILEVPSGP